MRALARLGWRKTKMYNAELTEKSHCPKCDQVVILLTADDGPSFYICPQCLLIAQVAVGEVMAGPKLTRLSQSILALTLIRQFHSI